MQRGSGLATHIIGAAFIVLADSFREAYVHTGMNVMQSVVLCAIDVGRRGWRAVRGSGAGRSARTSRTPGGPASAGHYGRLGKSGHDVGLTGQNSPGGCAPRRCRLAGLRRGVPTRARRADVDPTSGARKGATDDREGTRARRP